jgi:hypothetical protein
MTKKKELPDPPLPQLFVYGGISWSLRKSQLTQLDWNDIWTVYPQFGATGGPVLIGRHDGTPKLHSAMNIDFELYERLAEAFFETIPCPPLPEPDETKELKTRLAKIKKIAERALGEEDVSDVKYTMREIDRILVLAGGKKTNAW